MKRIHIQFHDDFPKHSASLENVAYHIRISRVLGSPSCKTFPPCPALWKPALFLEPRDNIPRAELLAQRHNLRMFHPVDIIAPPPAVPANTSAGVARPESHPRRTLRLSEKVEPICTFENVENFCASIPFLL